MLVSKNNLAVLNINHPLNHMFSIATELLNRDRPINLHGFSNQGSGFGPLQIWFDRQRGLLAMLQMLLEAISGAHHEPDLDARSRIGRCVLHESSGNGINQTERTSGY